MLPIPKPAHATLPVQDNQHDHKSALTAVRPSSFSEPHDAKMNSTEPYRRADPAFVLALLLGEIKAAKLPKRDFAIYSKQKII